MTYVIHFRGLTPVVLTFSQLDQIPELDRARFQYMLAEKIRVTDDGARVYQIRGLD